MVGTHAEFDLAVPCAKIGVATGTLSGNTTSGTVGEREGDKGDNESSNLAVMMQVVGNLLLNFGEAMEHHPNVSITAMVIDRKAAVSPLIDPEPFNLLFGDLFSFPIVEQFMFYTDDYKHGAKAVTNLHRSFLRNNLVSIPYHLHYIPPGNHDPSIPQYYVLKSYGFVPPIDIDIYVVLWHFWEASRIIAVMGKFDDRPVSQVRADWNTSGSGAPGWWIGPENTAILSASNANTRSHYHEFVVLGSIEHSSPAILKFHIEV
ncbi:hypothetical protein FPV67DRAFT_1454466 [Lyophyllum atratum]|nr:hypothetical protein FPV67DRAFT_1454466 [Lyophyllum atratum]